MKVMTIVGTRPEIIKLALVIRELDAYTHHVLVHTGQNFDYELNGIFFAELGIRKPDYFLDAAGDNAVQTIANVLTRADALMARERPDAVLLYGDTNSCLAVIAAKRRKIPVFHMEAGNRCFDQRVPEELNRKVIDHLSDVNLVLTEHARRYLVREGLPPETVIKTGSSMKEVLAFFKDRIDGSRVLADLGLEKGGYFVVSCHREENVDSAENFRRLQDALREIARRYGMPVVVSVHPRTRKRLEAEGVSLSDEPLIRLMRPLGFFEYVRLQEDAFCVISDSGTVTEESSVLGFPAVTIRDAHERPEGMDEGTLVMSSLDPGRVVNAIDVVTGQMRASGRMSIVKDYDVDNVSRKVVRIILSYVDYVNRTVWRRG